MRSVLVVLVSLPIIVLLAFLLLAADTTVLSLSSGPMMRWGVVQEAAAPPPTAIPRRGEGVVLVEKEGLQEFEEEEEKAEALLLPPCNYTLLSSRPESVYWKGSRRGKERRPEGLEPYSRVRTWVAWCVCLVRGLIDSMPYVAWDMCMMIKGSIGSMPCVCADESLSRQRAPRWLVTLPA